MSELFTQVHLPWTFGSAFIQDDGSALSSSSSVLYFCNQQKLFSFLFFSGYIMSNILW